MKKLYMIVLGLIITAFLLSSCHIGNPIQTEDSTVTTSTYDDRTDISLASDDTNDTKETGQTTTDTTESTTFEIPINRSFEKLASYPTINNMTESKDFVLFDYRGTIFYYDKNTEEVGQYCFDENCDHKNWKECISLQFLMQDRNQSVLYCEEDHRFYSLRGQKLCSFSHDGKDVRIEYSFGESGDFDEFLYDIWSVYDLRVVENYLYMIVCEEDSHKKNLYRYDVITQEMICLSQEIPGDIEHYFIYGDKIYFSYKGGYREENAQFCYATLEMTDIHMLWTIRNGMDIAANGIIYGEHCYFAEINQNSVNVYTMSLNTHKVDIHSTLSMENTTKILAVDKENIYLLELKQHPTYNSNLYALNIQTGTMTLVFDGIHNSQNINKVIRCRMENLRFLPDHKVLFTGIAGNSVLYIADIDQDGCFVNFKKLLQ